MPYHFYLFIRLFIRVCWTQPPLRFIPAIADVKPNHPQDLRSEI